MESFLNRYRNLTVMLLVIAGQLLLLAYQVKGNQDVRLIRVWAVTAVTPVARVVESVRANTFGFVRDYFFLLGARQENHRMHEELGKLKIENQWLKTELSRADRAEALKAFQERTPSKTLPARIIGNGTGVNSRVVFLDRGYGDGISPGMPVITADGIVGKIISSYPTSSMLMLITDSSFAAGVISQKSEVRGTLKGQGQANCLIDYVPNEQKVQQGEWFYTSGDDRLFPRGFPVGRVAAVHPGRNFQEIYLAPSGLQSGLDQVLVVLEGVHQRIPEPQLAEREYHLTAPVPEPPEAAQTATSALATPADKLREEYKQTGEAQNHKFGEGAPGSKPPDFTKVGVKAQPAPAAGAPPLTAGNEKPPTAKPREGAANPATAGAAAEGAATPVAAGAAAGAAANAALAPRKPAGVRASETSAAREAPPRHTGPLLVTDPADDVNDDYAPPPPKPRVRSAAAPETAPGRAGRPESARTGEAGSPKNGTAPPRVARPLAGQKTTHNTPQTAPGAPGSSGLLPRQRTATAPVYRDATTEILPPARPRPKKTLPAPAQDAAP